MVVQPPVEVPVVVVGPVGLGPDPGGRDPLQSRSDHCYTAGWGRGAGPGPETPGATLWTMTYSGEGGTHTDIVSTLEVTI